MWIEGKHERSRRTFGIDADTSARLTAHRKNQLEERLLAGSEWDDQNMVLSTQTINRLSPGNFDQTLERLVMKAGVLGHSPDRLMRTDAHALPDSLRP